MQSQHCVDPADYPAAARELRHCSRRDHTAALAQHAHARSLRTSQPMYHRHDHMHRAAQLIEARSRDANMEARS